MGCNRETTQEQTGQILNSASRVAAEVGLDPGRAKIYERVYCTLEAHNKGQGDAAKPLPASNIVLDIAAMVIDFSTVGLTGLTADKRYDPPSDPELRKAYNTGWINTQNQKK